MAFVILMCVIAALAWTLGKLGVEALKDHRLALRIGMSVGFLFVGIDHLVTPERYLPMMPPFVPWHAEVIFFTGLCEIAGAIGLLWPRVTRLAALMLALYAVAVFPANIHNALSGLSVEGLPQSTAYYWVRLAFQPLIIWWALYAGGLIGKRAPLTPGQA